GNSVYPSFPTRRSSDLVLGDVGVRRNNAGAKTPGKNLSTARADIAQANNADCFAFDLHADHARSGAPSAVPHGPRSLRQLPASGDRKSTRLNSSHVKIS